MRNTPLRIATFIFVFLVVGDAMAGQLGKASWYWQAQGLACGGRHAGRGEGRMYAAHKTLPCGTHVLVAARNGRSINATIMDRGPYVRGRIIDLFPAAARALGMVGAGVMSVVVLVR